MYIDYFCKNQQVHSCKTNMQRMAKSHQLEDAPPELAGVAQSQTQR